MEGYEKNDGMEMNDRDEIYSKPVRAGKRTYFFDVKATRNNDYYLTITESKKKLEKDGSQNYEKHKLLTEKQWQSKKKLKQTNLTTLILTIYPNNQKSSSQ